MPDGEMKSSELLSAGQPLAGLPEGGAPRLGATHAENAGLPVLESGAEVQNMKSQTK